MKTSMAVATVVAWGLFAGLAEFAANIAYGTLNAINGRTGAGSLALYLTILAVPITVVGVVLNRSWKSTNRTQQRVGVAIALTMSSVIMLPFALQMFRK